MTDYKIVLAGKALGIIKGIENLDDFTVRRNPSADFGDNYNRLIDLVVAQYEELADYLPPKVGFLNKDHEPVPCDSSGRKHTARLYGEIATFCHELNEILSAYEPDSGA